MKKILLGLVIAVMMTGSGFARELEATEETCMSLESRASDYLNFSIDESNRKYPRFDAESDYVSMAMQYLSLWSALCKD